MVGKWHTVLHNGPTKIHVVEKKDIVTETELNKKKAQLKL